MRIRWDIIAGILAIPGFVVIACVLAWAPLADWAECSLIGMEMRCPPTPSGAVARFVGTVVTLTYIFSFVGIGILPPVYSVLWALRRAMRRFGWSAVIGAFFVLSVALGMVARLLHDGNTDTLIGLAALGVVAWFVWRAVRRRRAPPPG